MKVVYEVCCGIDVHAKMLVACLIGADGTKQIRTYSTMTDDLLKLHEWLVAAGCTQVAIESTGVYWKPVFNVLEDALTVILVNPEHARALRGRKTDVKDAEWLADLLRHDLLQPSFIPPPEIRELRELTRYRESLVGEQAAVANRIQKLIESANIKLGQVATDVLGASGRAMLRALAEGETEPSKLADLAGGQLKEKRALLIRALPGRLTTAQRLVLGELLARWSELETAEARSSRRLTSSCSRPRTLGWPEPERFLIRFPDLGRAWSRWRLRRLVCKCAKSFLRMHTWPVGLDSVRATKLPAASA